MKVYIPCFFKNFKEREERFYICLRQYLELGYEVVVYWMNDEDIQIKHKNLTCIKSEQKNGSCARNKLLDIFYNSKDEFAIFSDDDTYLNEKIFSDKDCESFTNDYYENVTETEKISSAIFILKNIRPKVYFDESIQGNEDLDFGLALISQGFKTYRNSSKKVNIFRGVSTIFENGADKIYKKQKSAIQIKNKYKPNHENIRNSK